MMTFSGCLMPNTHLRGSKLWDDAKTGLKNTTAGTKNGKNEHKQGARERTTFFHRSNSSRYLCACRKEMTINEYL